MDVDVDDKRDIENIILEKIAKPDLEKLGRKLIPTHTVRFHRHHKCYMGRLFFEDNSCDKHTKLRDFTKRKISSTNLVI